MPSSKLLAYASSLLRTRVTILESFVIDFPADHVQVAHFVAAPKLLLLRSGRVAYELEGWQTELRRGSMLYRPAWTRATWWPVGGEPCGFSAVEYLGDVPDLPPIEPIVLSEEATRREEAALLRITEAREVGLAAGAIIAEGEFKGIVARFFALAEARGARRLLGLSRAAGWSPESNRATMSSATRSAVEGAVSHLQSHFRTAVDVARVAERFGLSDRTFRRAFTAHMGMNPQRYLTTLRMYAAWYFLKDSGRSVKEVASHLGYADPLYFSRQFRAFWGAPPTRLGPLRPFPFGSTLATFNRTTPID